MLRHQHDLPGPIILPCGSDKPSETDNNCRWPSTAKRRHHIDFYITEEIGVATRPENALLSKLMMATSLDTRNLFFCVLLKAHRQADQLAMT